MPVNIRQHPFDQVFKSRLRDDWLTMEELFNEYFDIFQDRYRVEDGGGERGGGAFAEGKPRAGSDVLSLGRPK
ncbi:MAG: hypothetical protein OEM41_09110 [Ignavibacteria bacterium]|nr:hypothetical protein [Ignavibacteria bacterium]